MWLSVHHGNFRLTLRTFFRPLNAPIDILDQLQSSLQNIKWYHFDNLVLLGDLTVAVNKKTDRSIEPCLAR